jgi:hypothetical protein
MFILSIMKLRQGMEGASEAGLRAKKRGWRLGKGTSSRRGGFLGIKVDDDYRVKPITSCLSFHYCTSLIYNQRASFRCWR